MGCGAGRESRPAAACGCCCARSLDVAGLEPPACVLGTCPPSLAPSQGGWVLLIPSQDRCVWKREGASSGLGVRTGGSCALLEAKQNGEAGTLGQSGGLSVFLQPGLCSSGGALCSQTRARTSQPCAPWGPGFLQHGTWPPLPGLGGLNELHVQPGAGPQAGLSEGVLLTGAKDQTGSGCDYPSENWLPVLCCPCFPRRVLGVGCGGLAQSYCPLTSESRRSQWGSRRRQTLGHVDPWEPHSPT